MKHKIPLILFAGGKSSRMGKDKTLLPFAGYSSMTEYQYRRLSKLFNTIYISCKNNKFDFDADLICDLYEESSPLVGIVSVFETLDTDKVFILSVDAPFVDEAVIRTLIEKSEGHDVTIAETEGGRQPLCGIYTRTVLPFAKKNAEEDNHRIGNVLKEVDTELVFFEEDSAFRNLNHPHEYEEALSTLKNRQA